MRTSFVLRALLPFAGAFVLEGTAFAQQPPATPPAMGTPPPEAKAVVTGPKETDAPKIEKKLDGTTLALSAGGLLTSGNSRLLALSTNGQFETRFDDNGIGASILGNYGQGAPLGERVRVTTQNIQGRLRYDRYIVDQLAGFILNTGRHDRFQGLDFRYNLDPGVKYLFIPEATRALWVELGYDLQHDIRRNNDRVVLDDNKQPVIDPATGQPQLLDKTFTDHSLRLFAGHKHAFNKEVTLQLGLEYLQSFKDVDRYRLNGDAVFAAKVGGGFAVGLGFSARYDHAPLPGKEKLDTSTTLSLIYAYSDIVEPKEEKCPCPDPAAPPPEPPPSQPPPPPQQPPEPPPPPPPVTIPPPTEPTPQPEPAPAPTPAPTPAPAPTN